MMNYIRYIDLLILKWMNEKIRSRFLDIFMPRITRLGDGGLVWILLAFILIANTDYRVYGYMVIVALLINVIIGNLILKPVIARIRPFDADGTLSLLIPKPRDYSFPSGHTMSSFAAALIILYSNHIWGIFAVSLALCIGFSRIYLLVHYASDVVAGMVIGVIISIVTIKLFEFLELVA